MGACLYYLLKNMVDGGEGGGDVVVRMLAEDRGVAGSNPDLLHSWESQAVGDV